MKEQHVLQRCGELMTQRRRRIEDLALISRFDVHVLELQYAEGAALASERDQQEGRLVHAAGLRAQLRRTVP
jgi:hypothetical protein